MSSAYLILADGTVYEGESVGFEGEAIGEVVFTTSMGGFSETISDQRYFGQLVMQTFPIVGGYGYVPSDEGNKTPVLSGYIVRELCENGSNFRMEGSLNDYLKSHNIVGIEGIDTRAVTRKLRDNGTMNGMICTNIKDLKTKLDAIKAFKAGLAVTNEKSEEIKGKHDTPYVALWDFGHCESILNMLNEEGVHVKVLSGQLTADTILKGGFDGVILSDGGGDPTANKDIVLQVQKLVNTQVKMLGLGLGHQLMAAANGVAIKKLKHGHRGVNHPVRGLKHDVVFVAGHNHGYTAVPDKSNANTLEIIFESVNDQTCEGISYKNRPQLSVQFDIESKGAKFILDEFLASLK